MFYAVFKMLPRVVNLRWVAKQTTNSRQHKNMWIPRVPACGWEFCYTFKRVFVCVCVFFYAEVSNIRNELVTIYNVAIKMESLFSISGEFLRDSSDNMSL